MSAAPRTSRSPVPLILVSIVVGAVLAIGFVLLTAPDGSEPTVTGSVMLAFGLGWALMAYLTLPDYRATYGSLRLAGGLAPSLSRIGLLGPLFGVSPSEATAAIARSQRDEFRALPAALEQAARVTSLGDIPLLVVSAGIESQRGWAAAQVAQLALSTNAVQRVIDGGTHASVIEGDDAPVSAQAILDVLAAVRGGTPLR